ncbi:ATP synthase F1, delta subunit [Ancylostoma ceylanicum]|uniref:Oligomycin sensitivity conferral protein n=1 Tax=Ancylostoma ceylanicum TaxID=53326 RepID=A0A0D6M0V3_9BILA|nr:ATP synthase F1, delta subunit [Ancylostoma ceylanicum]
MAQMLKRSFSMSATAFSGLVKAPVAVHGIEGRYASALYSAAHKQKSLDQVDKDLQKIRSVYQQDQKFKARRLHVLRDFVLDPTLKGLKKKQAVLAVAQKLGLSKESTNFLGLLAENGRLSKLEAVVASYEHIMRAHRGELFVQVTSAEPLSKSHESALSDALHKMAKSGQKLNVTYTVKPSIMGGLVVTIGDKYVDLSIASRIKKLKETLVASV